MNKLVVQVMLVSIIAATSVSAESVEPFAGLGSDRSTLSVEQIAARTGRLEESTTFALLRLPEARRAPARIFASQLWNTIQSAARERQLDPMVLAGMIFVESFGDPLAKSPTGPAGIAQLTKGSARELGLSTGRKVRVGSREVKKTRYVGKGKARRKIVETRRQPIYKTVDERYVPERAILAMAKRVSSRRAWLGGKIDFAIAEYHMGAGRMAKLLSAYFDRNIHVSDVPREMRDSGVSYPALFWTNTPYFRPDVYEALADLNGVDYSPTYYFRVQQAIRLLNIYRDSPAEYARLASVYQGRLGQTVLPSMQWSFVSEAEARAVPVRSAGDLQDEMGERFVLLPEIAANFGIRARPITGTTSVMAAERSTIGSALFIAHQLKQLQGDRYHGFEITKMLTHEGEEDISLPVHSFGWAFDVPTGSLSKSDKRDLKFILTDLRHAGLLAYVEQDEDSTFHVVRHPDHAARFEQFYWDVMAGSTPVAPPPQIAAFN